MIVGPAVQQGVTSRVNGLNYPGSNRTNTIRIKPITPELNLAIHVSPTGASKGEEISMDSPGF